MVATWKIEYVKQIQDMLKDKQVFGIANAMDIPSSSMQKIRKAMKERGVILKVVRKRLFLRALDALAEKDENIKKLRKMLENEKRITITLIVPEDNINPFTLYRLFEENKSYRAARAGDIAPNDIVINAGPTPFTPGPILSVLKKFGLKTKVEGGKIVITEDKVVARKGDMIDQELADLLNKFGLEPIEVKLRVIYVYHNGLIYTEDILSIPPEKYIEDLKASFRKAVAVAIEIALPTKDTIEILIRRSFENAVKLSMKTGIPTKDTIELLLKKAISTANLLNQKIQK